MVTEASIELHFSGSGSALSPENDSLREGVYKERDELFNVLATSSMKDCNCWQCVQYHLLCK